MLSSNTSPFSDQQWRTLLEATPDFIAVCDPDAHLVFANRPPFSSAPLPPLGSPIVDLVSSVERPALASTIARVRHNNTGETHIYTMASTDPENTRFRLSIQPEPEGTNVILVGRQLPSVTATLETVPQNRRSRIRAAQFHDSLAQLAGGLSHDFNNLLGAILANIWYVSNDLPAESPHRIALEEAQAATDHAAALCRDLQAYAGQTAGKPDKVAPHALVASMSRLLHTSVSHKASLTITAAERRENAHHVEANPAQLRQLIAILVANASEALEGGYGQIAVDSFTKHLDEEDLSHTLVDTELRAGQYVVIQVTDSGVGMDEETLLKAIQPFYSTKMGHRGLGLSAAMGIARAHGGSLLARSTPGLGTSISLILPTPQTLADGQGIDGTVLPKILIADDEPWMRSACKRILQQDGYQVLLASDGREAVDILKRQGDEISCVLMDLSMPELDGHEAMLLIRAARPRMPVLLMTGANDTQPDDVERCEVLAKPFLPDALLQMVGSALEPTRPHPSP
jgi:signal transduction histidine kinase